MASVMILSMALSVFASEDMLAQPVIPVSGTDTTTTIIRGSEVLTSLYCLELAGAPKPKLRDDMCGKGIMKLVLSFESANAVAEHSKGREGASSIFESFSCTPFTQSLMRLQLTLILDIDDCARQPCHHGGICTDLVDDFECSCPSGYVGKDCYKGSGKTDPILPELEFYFFKKP